MPVVRQAAELVARFTLKLPNITPQKGTTLIEEMRCYSLPYGAMGFVSHVLTYYVIACLWAARSPLWPARHVKHGKIDLLLGIFSVTISSGIAIFTIVSCKNSWQLLVIAVWKMSMSLLNGCTAVHAAHLAKKDGYEAVAHPEKTAWWILLYVPGMFAGISGLMSLVVQHLDNVGVLKLTIAFYSIIGIGALIILIGMFRGAFRKAKSKDVDGEEVLLWGMGGFGLSFTLFTILAAFYGDWALGMLVHNLIGLPSGDNSGLYWSYWLAKRFPMFSW